MAFLQLITVILLRTWTQGPQELYKWKSRHVYEDRFGFCKMPVGPKLKNKRGEEMQKGGDGVGVDPTTSSAHTTAEDKEETWCCVSGVAFQCAAAHTATEAQVHCAAEDMKLAQASTWTLFKCKTWTMHSETSLHLYNEKEERTRRKEKDCSTPFVEDNLGLVCADHQPTSNIMLTSCLWYITYSSYCQVLPPARHNWLYQQLAALSMPFLWFLVPGWV